ncbi:MAG: hypothetical protein IJS52_06165 [Bacilli bacterium]|nr:hypothetical protein [Bacilli bacterium]
MLTDDVIVLTRWIAGNTGITFLIPSLISVAFSTSLLFSSLETFARGDTPIRWLDEAWKELRYNFLRF